MPDASACDGQGASHGGGSGSWVVLGEATQVDVHKVRVTCDLCCDAHCFPSLVIERILPLPRLTPLAVRWARFAHAAAA